MKLHLGFISLSFLFGSLLFAQEGPVNSGELIRKGYAAYESKKYAESLEFYKKIPDYDTNGTIALYESALCLTAMEKYPEADKILARLVNEFKYYTPNTFNLWGNVVDDGGNPQEALKIFARGLELYPMSNMLAYNMAITYFKNINNNDSAKVYALRSADINVTHPGSFNLLGLIHVKEGQVVPAMMCYIHSILVGIEGNSSITPLQNINNLVTGGADAELKKAGNPYADFYGTSFKDEDYLIKTRSALADSYKKKVKFREAVALQTQFLMDILKEEHEKIPFYGPLHVRFLRQVKAQKLEETLTYVLFAPTEDPKVSAYIKSNSKKIKLLFEIFYKNIGEYRKTKNLEKFGIPGEFELSFYKNGAVETAFAKSDKADASVLTYFFTDDGHLLFKGNSKSKKWDGKVLMFDKENKLEEERTYVNGDLKGRTTLYYPDGKLKGTIDYPVNMATDTMYINFYFRDGVTPNFKYKKLNGNFEGRNIVYWNDGSIKFDLFYKKDKISGFRKSYYENGLLYEDENYVDGKQEGLATYYHNNGQISAKGNTKNNQKVGEWKEYYRSGKLYAERTYNDKGTPIGKNTEYYENGSIMQVEEYDLNGNQNGTIKLYGLSGKVHSEFVFANNKVKSCKLFDINGKETKSTVPVGKKLEFIKNDKYHRLYETGTIENDERNGLFVIYGGGKDSAYTSYFKNGKSDGEAKEFYSTGGLKKLTTYKDNKQNGKYGEYEKNGNVSYYGYFLNNEPEGIWRYYHDNGKPQETRFFVRGDKTGRFDGFDSEGNLTHSYFYEENQMVREIRFWEGKATDTINYESGKSEVVIKFPSGEVYEKYQLLNGVLHGEYNRYYPNGKVSVNSTYLNGYTNGIVKRYYPTGVLYSEVPFTIGRENGKGIYYNEMGKLESEIEFLYGDFKGKYIQYYPNGKVYRETNYADDEADGERIYYAPDGNVMVKLFYERGYLTGYTYLDKNGNFLPVMPLEGGNGSVKAFYKNGSKSCEFNFKKSYMDGEQKAYYPGSESLIYKENYAKFMQEGEQIYYFNGPNKKSKQLTYVNGNVEGLLREFHANGKISYEAEYKNDDINGYEKYFNENGTVLTHFTFINGKLIGLGK